MPNPIEKESYDSTEKEITLSHFNRSGEAIMVNVGDKEITLRTAIACGDITLSKELIKAIKDGKTKKGDVLGVSRIAGILAAKNTANLIPLCHNISLTNIEISFEILSDGIRCVATTRTNNQTGVEMEALTAVSVSLLTVYDMCKSHDKNMIIRNIMLLEKTGGKSR